MPERRNLSSYGDVIFKALFGLIRVGVRDLSEGQNGNRLLSRPPIFYANKGPQVGPLRQRMQQRDLGYGFRG